jgi:hypothetical protein
LKNALVLYKQQANDKKAEKISLDEHRENFEAAMLFFNANGKKLGFIKKF